MQIFWQLFITFFKIGAFTFGGGLAMFPMLKKELVENRGWVTEDEIMNYYAIGQCTPGIIAVNTATFVGYKLKGYLGAIFSTLGIVLPSILIIILIASFIQNFLNIEWVINMFAGIKIAVSALIIDVVFKLLKNNLKDKIQILFFSLAFIFNFALKISPIYIIFSTIILCFILARLKIYKEEK